MHKRLRGSTICREEKPVLLYKLGRDKEKILNKNYLTCMGWQGLLQGWEKRVERFQAPKSLPARETTQPPVISQVPFTAVLTSRHCCSARSSRSVRLVSSKVLNFWSRSSFCLVRAFISVLLMCFSWRKNIKQKKQKKPKKWEKLKQNKTHMI